MSCTEAYKEHIEYTLFCVHVLTSFPITTIWASFLLRKPLYIFCLQIVYGNSLYFCPQLHYNHLGIYQRKDNLRWVPT